MKKIKICILLLLPFFCVACEEEEKCDEPITYRPEIGIGYVFQETDSGLVPVAGAKNNCRTSLLERRNVFWWLQSQ